MLSLFSGLLYIAIAFKDDCPAEDSIVGYMGALGGLFIIRIVLYCMDLWLVPHISSSFGRESISALNLVFNFLIVIVSVVGIARVIIVAWPDLMDKKSLNYCNPIVYLVALVAFVDVLFGALFWCTCFCCFFPRGWSTPKPPVEDQNTTVVPKGRPGVGK